MVSSIARGVRETIGASEPAGASEPVGAISMESALGCTLSGAKRVTPFMDPLIVTVLAWCTGARSMLKNVMLVPSGTCTLGGTLATSGWLLASVLITPPVGAGALNASMATDNGPRPL